MPSGLHSFLSPYFGISFYFTPCYNDQYIAPRYLRVCGEKKFSSCRSFLVSPLVQKERDNQAKESSNSFFKSKKVFRHDLIAFSILSSFCRGNVMPTSRERMNQVKKEEGIRSSPKKHILWLTPSYAFRFPTSSIVRKPLPSLSKAFQRWTRFSNGL